MKAQTAIPPRAGGAFHPDLVAGMLKDALLPPRKRQAHDAPPTRLTTANPARQITRPRRPQAS